ncbi:MAG: 6-phosphogluconolactonase [Paludibacteraceae bacterium]
MLHSKIHIQPEPELVAEAVAKLIVERQKSKLSAQKSLNIAVSGGSTPNILFGMLANEYADKIDWTKIKIFWVDERCVAANDNESNFGTAYKILLKKIPVPQENIFKIDGDNEPVAEAIQYQKVLQGELPNKDGFPVFDLILLGMGDDGHTASIFPNNLGLIHSNETVVSVKHPQTKQQRITITGNVICNAEQVVFLITGHPKAEVLDSIINEKGDFERYPAYYVLAECDAELYLDDAAAERL